MNLPDTPEEKLLLSGEPEAVGFHAPGLMSHGFFCVSMPATGSPKT
jgi:hypothetical protein